MCLCVSSIDLIVCIINCIVELLWVRVLYRVISVLITEYCVCL